MTQSPLALAAIGVLVTALIAVLTVVTDGASLSRWERALVIASAVPVGVGVVWALRRVALLRASCRRLAAMVGIRAVEAAFAYVNPPIKPARVVGFNDTAALVVPVDSRMSVGATFTVYDDADGVAGVVEVKRIERGEAVCPVVSRLDRELWNNLEERIKTDDSPPDLRVRLERSEEARASAIEALRAWRMRE